MWSSKWHARLGPCIVLPSAHRYHTLPLWMQMIYAVSTEIFIHVPRKYQQRQWANLVSQIEWFPSQANEYIAM